MPRYGILHIPSATLWYPHGSMTTKDELVEQLRYWMRSGYGSLEIRTRPLTPQGLGSVIDSWDYEPEHLSIVEVESETCEDMVGQTVFIVFRRNLYHFGTY